MRHLCACGGVIAKGSTNRCKPCDAEYKWYWTNKKRFNLSRDDLDSMYKDQEGCCKICKQPFIGQRPCVDHCHTTNKVRGLLCSNCNKGLGHFFDNIESLNQAITYLRNDY
jgi:hypothetical protein